MSFLDKVRGTAKSLAKDSERWKGQAVEAVQQHEAAIHTGIDKAADAANRATKGKYSHQIAKGAVKARQGVEKVKESRPGPDSTGPTGPTGPPPR